MLRHIGLQVGRFHSHRFSQSNGLQLSLTAQFIGAILTELQPCRDLIDREQILLARFVQWAHQRPLNQQRLNRGESDQQCLRNISDGRIAAFAGSWIN